MILFMKYRMAEIMRCSMADQKEHHHTSKNSQSVLEPTGSWLVSGQKESRYCKNLFHSTRREMETLFSEKQ